MYVAAWLLLRAVSYMGVLSPKASVDLVPVHILQEMTCVASPHAVNKTVEFVHPYS